MPVESTPITIVKPDFVSEEMCPDGGQAIGEHFFRACEPNVPCNCTLWIIAYVRLPRVTLRCSINGLFVVIILGKDGNRL